MAVIGFGPLVEVDHRSGKRHLVSDLYLHIQETWRIVRNGAVQVGHADWHYPPVGSGVSYVDFDAKESRHTARDDLVKAWQGHEGAGHVVASASGTDAGDLRIVFEDECLLETFVNQASVGDADEIWRLLPPRSTALGSPHFVVSYGGSWSN